jgi:hypothetical protein
METLRRLCPTVLLALFALAGVPAARAQGVGEPELKAAFLLNFARYVQWPADAFASADAPLLIGVIGDGQVASAIESLVKGERAGSHPIGVQRLGSAAAAKSCQLVFIGGGSSSQLDAMSGRAAGCLTVGDSEDFLRHGGAIRFFSGADRKVRFEINPKAIERQRLKPSASIMRLARIATDGR